MSTKRLLNDRWTFAKYPVDTTFDEIRPGDFTPVNIPHDWMIYQTDALYETGTGFYRRTLEKQEGGRTELYFEGVYMDSLMYINGQQVFEWKYGYSSFFVDVTDYLTKEENEIVLRVEYRSPNSRWYSGAGIYRNVWLIRKEEEAFVTDSLYLSALPEGVKELTPETDLTGNWILTASAELPETVAENLAGHFVSLTLTDPAATLPEQSVTLPLEECLEQKGPEGAPTVTLTMTVSSPELWEEKSPKLYGVQLSLLNNDKKSTENIGASFGFRAFAFTTDRGLFVNGKHIKLQGVCEHHDLGALGAAYNSTAMRRKLETLRTMGVNAIRTSHNMPAVDLLDLCDELGFLVMDESFDCWEWNKTEFDYGRFFKEWHATDVRSWVRRDRNHACLLMWSIGNEIYDTHAPGTRGQEVTLDLQTLVRSHDYRNIAVVGLGSNYMPWEGAQKCADILKFAGYNYAEKLYDEHHTEHPDWYIFGSETSSTVQSRGIYHFPQRQATLSEVDEQCSSLGNSTTSWGAVNTESCIIAERDHEFSLGQFLWSGFDYIGEPTPYQTRSCYFGQIDTAGFAKDSFYLYKSAWKSPEEQSFVHVWPYWDFNPGQEVDVRIATDAPEAELFLNGRSLGRRAIDHAHGKKLTADFTVPYEAGELTAVAYDAAGKEIARESRHSFGEAVSLKIRRCRADRPVKSGCGDLAFYEVWAEDAEGYPVENACNLCHVTVEGAGWLTGLDNGDSTDKEPYKGHYKRLFSGKMLVIIAAGAEAGEVRLSVTSDGLTAASDSFTIQQGEPVPGISLIPEIFPDVAPAGSDTPRVRKIELSCEGDRAFDADRREITVTAKILPENASGAELIWEAVTDAGVASPVAKVKKTEGNTAIVEAFGDGSFALRCMTKNGADQVRVMSRLEFTARGIGRVTLDPYSFVSASMYTYSEGELGNGQEHGVSTERNARSVVGFDHVDFGEFGSDEITLPIFEMASQPEPVEIWEGIPEAEGSTLLGDFIYHKPCIWEVYQEETVRLNRRVKGVTTICFVFRQRLQLKGFSFQKQEKAFSTLLGGECDNVYGDKFTREEKRISGIGNNVTVTYENMDFGETGTKTVTICGYTDKPVNTIHLLFTGEGETIREILEFPHAEETAEVTFPIQSIFGVRKVELVFLPGSSFDLESIRFS
jgi:beta-galactosidase